MKKLTVLILIFFSFTLLAGNNKVDKATEAKVKALANNQQLEFIENKGQFANSEGKPADNVLFKASYGNCDIYITEKGLSYVFYKIEEKESDSNSTKLIKSGSSPLRRGGGVVKGAGGEVNDTNRKVFYYRLDMDLVGATIFKDNIIKEEESKQGHYNYFYPHCPEGIYNVKAYGKITIKNIYKGIDWVIYTNKDTKEQPIKYDFVVHPNADYNDIKIKYINADSLSLLDNDTKLKITTIAGTIEEGNIYSYQNKEIEIQSNYVMNTDSTVSFAIADYDRTQTLIIDPLVWATSYGYGVTAHRFFSICVDSQDNIYITGNATNGYVFPTQQLTGAFWQPIMGSGYSGYPNSNDACILKFNSNCVRLWATYYGGDNVEQFNSVSVDSQDNIFITGASSSTNFPTQQLAGAYWQPINAGFNATLLMFRSNVVILKFNSQGVRLWATYYGGSSNCVASVLRIDSQDNIYIVGNAALNFPTQQLAGAYWQPAIIGGGDDLFILKFNNQGVRLWATFYGGSSAEIGVYGGGTNGGNIIGGNACIDSQDNLYIVGGTKSTNFPTQQLAGAYWQATNNTNIGGFTDETAFILKFNSQGVRQWATYYGGSYSDQANSICVDSQDNILVTGYTESTDFPTQQMTGAFWQATTATTFNAPTTFILKFNNLGVRQWSTYYGGNTNDVGLDIRVDKLDNIFVCGFATSINFPIQQLAGEYYQSQNSGCSSYLIKFNNIGIRQWATFYCINALSSGVGDGRAFAVNHQNAIYNIGSFGYPGLGTSIYTVDPGNGAYYESALTYTNSANCNYILKIAQCYVKKPDSLHTNKNNICSNDNGTIILKAIGGRGDTLKWYTGSFGQNYIGHDTLITIPSPTQTTTYYACWESSCDTSECDSITINVFPIATTNLNPVICQGHTYQVGSHLYSITGIYSDTLTASNGCDSIITTKLKVIPMPVINFNNDTNLCNGQVLILDVTNQNSTYLWQDSTTNPVYYINQQGVYWVTVSDSICIVSDSINVKYKDCFKPDIYIPNAFTPNGDGQNDVFKIETLAEFSEFHFYIYNRWGELIFESNDKTKGWDGTFKGKLVPNGVYVYLVKGILKDNNEQIERTGTVTVVR